MCAPLRRAPSCNRRPLLLLDSALHLHLLLLLSMHLTLLPLQRSYQFRRLELEPTTSFTACLKTRSSFLSARRRTHQGSVLVRLLVLELPLEAQAL